MPACFELRVRETRLVSIYGQLRFELAHPAQGFASLLDPSLRNECDRKDPPGGGMHAIEKER